MTKLALDWNVSNQRYLLAWIRAVRYELELFQAVDTDPSLKTELAAQLALHRQLVQEIGESMTESTALDVLTDVLGLSDFERKILLLCAAVELDTLPLVPTFGLALAAFAENHWSALSPNGPLRYWQLLELTNGPSLTQNRLRIDEQVLHFLTGVYQLDDRLREWVTPVPITTTIRTGSSQNTIEQIRRACLEKPLPVIWLEGTDEADQRALAAELCAEIGLKLLTTPAHALPTNPAELSTLTRLWNREAALHGYALHVDCTELDRTQTQTISAFIDRIQGDLWVSGGGWKPRIRRDTVTFTIRKPSASEQLVLWNNYLPSLPPKALQELVSQFDLGMQTIRTISNALECRLLATPTTVSEPSPELTHKLWQHCCTHTRPQVDDLAQRLEPVATWNDLVLPETQLQTLHDIVAQVQHRHRVYTDWGFSKAGARGMGITALFAGESGTGKTMAAEVLANALNLDLYRIDLSQVVNQYIGQTEKNLRKIFDAAEAGGAILLFDEADALFGKRTEVKDSHDRYSNIEVSYLLQRMEAYRGLAILTTNMRSALDKAFLRRLRFVVSFAFPDAAHRADIWRRVFPPDMPRHELDYTKLARLNIPGGNIRNIALCAAFRAAHDDQPVQMHHLAQAARSEYAKLERPLTQTELQGW